MSAPIVSTVLTVHLPVVDGRADLRRASMALVSRGTTVRVESGEARFFDQTHVGLFAAALAPAGHVQFNGTDSVFLDAVKAALLAVWEVAA